MLTPQSVRHILHTVNLQINSNNNFIKPTPSIFNISQKIRLYMQTRNSLKQLYKSYPSQHLNRRQNLLRQFALTYSNFRNALSLSDQPMLHRYLTNSLYQHYKQKHKFKIYPTVHNIQLKQAQLYQNQYGKWVQCLVAFKHQGNQRKFHVLQRKLGSLGGVRTWYFTEFQDIK